MKKDPLVSICTPNYNHSRYLDTCITSVLSQTYKNIDYVVLDNQSEDNSVDVISKYAKDGVRICRNAINIMSASYRVLIEKLVDSNAEYAMLLPADDYIEPTFIEKCVSVMEKYPKVGYVHVERDFITETNEFVDLDPFYNCSFVCPGVDAMPIYMMTTIAHPAQALFRLSAFRKCRGYNMMIDHFNADKALWFYMSAISDCAYIREKLSKIRIGMQSETVITQTNFQHPLLGYLTLLEFIDFAERNAFESVLARKNTALLKLATEYLSHVASAFLSNNISLGEKYLVFCMIISREIEQNADYQVLQNMRITKSFDDIKLKELCRLEAARKRGYSPPDNYVEIDVEGAYQEECDEKRN